MIKAEIHVGGMVIPIQFRRRDLEKAIEAARLNRPLWFWVKAWFHARIIGHLRKVYNRAFRRKKKLHMVPSREVAE